MRALTERPACFEIDPRGVRSSAPIGYGCRTQLITAYNDGSISSSRCQTTCIAMIEINATQIPVHGRAMRGAGFVFAGVADRPWPTPKPFTQGLVEPDGIEPT